MLFNELHFKTPAGNNVCKYCKCHVCCKQNLVHENNLLCAYIDMSAMQVQQALSCIARPQYQSRTGSISASIISWFFEHNAKKLQKGINVIQPLEIFLRELDTLAGLFDILRPRNRTRAALLCTFATLCLLVCAQFCHIISKAESIPAIQQDNKVCNLVYSLKAADRHPHDSDSFAQKAYML